MSKIATLGKAFTMAKDQATAKVLAAKSILDVQRTTGMTAPIEMYSGTAPEDRIEIQALVQQALERGQAEDPKTFNAYQHSTIAAAIAPFLPAGVDPASVASLFLHGNVLDQINPQVEDWDSPVRKITYNALPFPSEVLYEAINQVPDRKQNGVVPGSSIMSGLKGDVVFPGPVERTVFVNFDLAGRARGSERLYPGLERLYFGSQTLMMSRRGQVFAQPGDLVLPVAVQLAKYGWEDPQGDLLVYRDEHHIVRTEKAKAKNGMDIWSLTSGGFGVTDNGYDFDDDYVRLAAAGSPNHSGSVD